MYSMLLQENASLRISKQIQGLLITILMALWIGTTQAEVVLDGTLGKVGALPGPNFAIGSEVGKQMGNNLFHSFQTFNLNKDESATFSGPENIQNIISRVTGGQVSSIDGQLRSTIANANLYLINPQGVLFGENASLDIKGSFYVTTADTVRLGTEGQFNARIPKDSVLTTAAPSAFGFLGNTANDINIQGSYLQVPSGKTLSIVGGHLNLKNATLFASDGTVQLVSTQAEAELPLNNNELANKTLNKAGKINISRSADVAHKKVSSLELGDVDVSGRAGGLILIRAGQLTLESSYVFADTYGDKTGQGIQIVTDESVRLNQKSRMTTDNYNVGKGGNIAITTPSLVTDSNSVIQASAQRGKTGNSGNINLKVGQLAVQNGAGIRSITLGAGQSGIITIVATDNVSVKNQGSAISVTAQESATGNAGSIRVETPRLILENEGFITSIARGVGGSGNITIVASEGVEISQSAGISTLARENSTQDAGTVNIDTDTLSLKTGGFIDSSTRGASKGGNIVISAKSLIILAQQDSQGKPGIISSSSYAKGQGGTIQIAAPRLEIYDKGEIQTATFDGSTGNAGNIQVVVDKLVLDRQGTIVAGTKGAGQGGQIEIIATEANLANKAEITSKSEGGTGIAGSVLIIVNSLNLGDSSVNTQSTQSGGGDIELTVSNRLYLVESAVSARAQGQKPEDKGGNLTVKQPTFVILDKSQLLANAKRGNGGNIDITANEFISSNDSKLDASSELGIAGQILIRSPDTDVGSKLIVLPTTYLNAAALLQQGCADRFGKNTSSFVAMVYQGLPVAPYDVRSSPGSAFKTVSTSKDNTTVSSTKPTFLLGCTLARLAAISP